MIPREVALQYGLSGANLRASGVDWDLRRDQSLPMAWDKADWKVWTHPDGDSFARYWVRLQEVREATNYQIPIQLKLGAARVYDDVRMAAKCGPDVIYLDGSEGGTGAGPHIATEETGIPLMAAIPEARREIELDF